jgi:hypothetical protein
MKIWKLILASPFIALGLMLLYLIGYMLFFIALTVLFILFFPYK